jgi:peptide chain release factor 1
MSIFNRLIVGKTISMGARAIMSSPMIVLRSPPIMQSPAVFIIHRRNFLSPALTRRLDSIVSRHEELLALIEESPEDGFTHGKELSSLAQVVSLDEKIKAYEEEEQSIKELRQEAGEDKDLQQECSSELERLEVSKTRLQKKIRNALLPKDEDDTDSDAIVEIRAGTGGDEAALFAAELREAYEKTAKSMRWEHEVLSESRTDLGGIKETVLSISARGGGGAGMQFADEDDEEEDDDFKAGIAPFGLFRYESGVHRVQRVPVNDTKIQTSACSVAVLPSFQDDKSLGELLPMSELRIETMRSSGAGGQHVNTTDSAVRVTHIPTGITASIQDERSQHKNKHKALKLIAARVRAKQREAEESERGAARSSLMGGGDRSERIRTYNYPQDRVTDHRCKETTHGISKLLEGGADVGLVATFYPSLRDMVQEEQLSEMEKET